METQKRALLDAGHLSRVQEESDSPQVRRELGEGTFDLYPLRVKVKGNCFLPPIIGPSSAPRLGEQEVLRGAGLASLTPNQQRPEEEDGSLLEELGRIEADLRESLRVDTERQREAEFLRQQENKRLRTSLCHLSLSQRVARPWVSSYFRRFPMHIYCLPVQAANHRAKKGARTTRR
ncbi:hypothetical protein D4764_22G0000670 [Takifugu flavidus]|uniref:Uncharacterized protein n=1 Tax=Takifugu flavidus TaxID=433684 RepID=A0A5C6NEL8_9TELE|nr:hypothetical protein D4764_22G0000670 [Takifugu flavidus]